MRLAIYMHDLAGGGVERMRLALVRAFLERGIAVTLLLHRRAGELVDAVPDGVPVVELGGRSTLGDVPALARFLRRERPDLLMASLDHNNIAALLARRLARTSTPVVICQHNALSAESGAMPWRYRTVPLLYRLLAREAAGIVAVSEGVAADLVAVAGLARERISVIHNPVIGPDFAGRAAAALPPDWAADPWITDPSVRLVVSAGRLVAQKDPETLLRAFALLPASQLFGQARLLLLGRGELQPRLEALAAELHLADRVRFAGFQPNPLPFLARADAFVLASRYEGLGNVLVEALGCGTPVVSTDCPHGPSEILERGQYGALVPVGDAHALAQALSDTLRRGPDAAALRARAAEFTVERAVGRHLALFERALASRRATVRPGATRRVFGLDVSPLDAAGVSDRVVREPPAGVALVVTPNIDHVCRLRRDPAFASAYADAAMVTADGFPVQLYARLRGARRRGGRVTGCEILARVLRHPDLPAHRPFFVADSEETVAGLRRWAAGRGVAGRIGFAVPPQGFGSDPAQVAALAAAIAAHGTTLLLMGVGAPRSEIFVHTHRDVLPPCWALCVGQALRIEAGLTQRAPRLVQRLNLEWAHRLLQEPRRLAGRYGMGAIGFTGAIVADLRGTFPAGGPGVRRVSGQGGASPDGGGHVEPGPRAL